MAVRTKDASALMTRRGVLAVAILLALGATAKAKEVSEAAGFIRSLGDRTITLLGQLSGDREALTRDMSGLLNEAMDIGVVARLALGRSWRQADEAQRRDYVELCRRYILSTLAQRFSSYAGSERFVVTGTRPAGDDTMVNSRIDYVGYPPLLLDWRVREAGRPAIVDVVVEGVSMVLTIRSEFEGVVARSGIDGLLRELTARIGVAPAGAG
jgi:phospholipid transport system substrate-binding protein